MARRGRQLGKVGAGSGDAIRRVRANSWRISALSTVKEETFVPLALEGGES